MKPDRHVHHALLAYLRHELCTPINGMIGYRELLLEALQTQQKTTWFGNLQKIYHYSKQLLTLVTVILAPKQLETGNNQIGGDWNQQVEGYSPVTAIETRTCDRPDDRVQSPNRLNQLALAASLPEKPQSVCPDAALQRLLKGNQRFVDEACQNIQKLRPIAATLTRSRLEETATAQYPFASILGCADSRAPTEIIFDQGVGDLFVVRVAGNVASQTVIGSLEFATSVLGTQLIVVVGHSGCGAVAAAVKGELLPGRISGFVEDIKPLVARVENKTGDLIENTVIANIRYQAQKLAESSTILANLIQAGKLKVVGGQYDLRTGKFTIVTL
jgi:carbonic anhydrase